MCRVLGCVAPAPVSLRHELLEAESAIAAAGAGCGMAVYRVAEGQEPRCIRRDSLDDELAALEGRIFNVHAGPTNPLCLGNYSFSHIGPGAERLFQLVIGGFDPGRPTDSLRQTVARAITGGAGGALDFLFSDGERLYGYRLGDRELHWRRAPDRLLIASERIGSLDGWHSVQQDVLLTLDPSDAEAPHAERLVGDDLARRARDRLIAAAGE